MYYLANDVKTGIDNPVIREDLIEFSTIEDAKQAIHGENGFICQDKDGSFEMLWIFSKNKGWYQLNLIEYFVAASLGFTFEPDRIPKEHLRDDIMSRCFDYTLKICRKSIYPETYHEFKNVQFRNKSVQELSIQIARLSNRAQWVFSLSSYKYLSNSL